MSLHFEPQTGHSGVINPVNKFDTVYLFGISYDWRLAVANLDVQSAHFGHHGMGWYGPFSADFTYRLYQII